EHELPLTIYTPLIQAQTVAIGNGPRDALVGFDSSGAMCIRANLGAIRVEQQLTGQSVISRRPAMFSSLTGSLSSCVPAPATAAANYKSQEQLRRRSPQPANPWPQKHPPQKRNPFTRSLCRR